MRQAAIRVALPVLAGLICASPFAAGATDAAGTGPTVRVAALPTPPTARPAAPGTQRQAALPAPPAVRPPPPAPRAASAAVPRPAAPAASPAGRQVAVTRARISCVPYARMVTGIDIRGNAREWWNAAAGRFDRSQTPEVGAVLSFPASGRMRLGHVAVVEQVLGARHILIHHANWEGPGIRKGTVTRGISVIDVSPDNDWTQVRVQAGLIRGSYGRIYPTHGFIHNRAPRPADTETREASRQGAPVELAEAPGGMSPHLTRHLSIAAEALHARN